MVAHILLLCALLVFPLGAHAAALCMSSHDPGLAKVLGFENPLTGNVPGGWGGVQLDTIFRDKSVTHGDQYSIRIERDPDSPSKFSSLTDCVWMDFEGKTITLRGFLRTEDVTRYTGLWLREDAYGGPVAFNNMSKHSVHGTTGWTEYSIT